MNNTTLSPRELQNIMLCLMQLKGAYEGNSLSPLMLFTQSTEVTPITWDAIQAVVGLEMTTEALRQSQITLLTQLIDRVGTAYISSPMVSK